MVQAVFRRYTQERVSINAIARDLNGRGVATRTGAARWCRSTVWAMLRNPAYMGLACFGKTETVERRKITRPLRQGGGYSPRNSANRERPREQWIGIPVPPLVSEETFALAQEKLETNKRFARVVVTPITGPLPAPPSASSTTTVASAPMTTATRTGASVKTAPCGKTT